MLKPLGLNAVNQDPEPEPHFDPSRGRTVSRFGGYPTVVLNFAWERLPEALPDNAGDLWSVIWSTAANKRAGLCAPCIASRIS